MSNHQASGLALELVREENVCNKIIQQCLWRRKCIDSRGDMLIDIKGKNLSFKVSAIFINRWNPKYHKDLKKKKKIALRTAPTISPLFCMCFFLMKKYWIITAH